MATCGLASGADEVFLAIQEQIGRCESQIVLGKTGCMGYCQKEPLINVIKPGWPRIIYSQIGPKYAKDIVDATVAGKIIPEYALCQVTDEVNLSEDSIRSYPLTVLPDSLQHVPRIEHVPFFALQHRRVLRNCGLIDPDNIYEYFAIGGYRALEQVLTRLSPDEVISEVSKSGLRGRGGAGFPTGRKWSLCRQVPGEFKYVICNADEGGILESDPHSVIEGMIIGAYAIGAKYGILYVRMEYPLAIERLKMALEQAQEHGFLGENILGSGFDFSIEIECGSGAFMGGEETALIASIEGKTGEPRQRPPYPIQSGLWGKPTNINNVKTWANVPLIISRGSGWFSRVGTIKSPGTAVFTLVGKVQNNGLVEVPLGISLHSLIYDIGEGIPDGKRLKAVQTGGPSGGCIPAELADVPVDFEKLAEVGSIMGSGGMVVMDERTCMVDVAKYSLAFSKEESCGKCVPCREGTRRMHDILTDITEGRGQVGDIELLEEMSKTIIDTALCGMGSTAPNPVLSTLHYFRDEYDQHIKYKSCPAMVCKKIIFTPCKHNCPVKTDVPAFIAHIARSEYREAFEIIRTPNPLPICCGYICHHPCEERCRSLETGGESISIKALKRFIGDYVIKNGFKPLPKPEVPPLEKIAIVGSGPAGLAAAFDLACLGYQPTVFEASSVVGGNLAMVIPEFRLPRHIIDLEIECIKQAGVNILTNTPVGSNLTLEDLFDQDYKAILLAVGAHRSLKLGLPGEETPGVMYAFGFLEAIKLGNKVALGEKVGIIGGGNAAIDAARTASRIGAREVSIIYRRSKAEMPAIKGEIEAALEEGVKILELTAPARIITQNGRLTGIE
jgi:NADH-quinone oxidoreductase subunit F